MLGFRKADGQKEVPLPGSFEEYWASRNSFKVPFNSLLRTEKDRHLMTWNHGISAWGYFNSDLNAFLKTPAPSSPAVRKLVEALREAIVELKKYQSHGLDRFGGHTQRKIELCKEALDSMKSEWTQEWCGEDP